MTMTTAMPKKKRNPEFNPKHKKPSKDLSVNHNPCDDDSHPHCKQPIATNTTPKTTTKNDPDKILARRLKKANGHLKNNDCRLSTCTALNDEEDDDEDEEANDDEEAEDQDDDDKDE